ncbi:MAG TPA: glycine betaine ABC transporter substrate-binding protein [Nocardioidaceae bacterium]|nr:glycine betaine ABC transporter substrate-binding protein [Nocardioidaceae bacterium]
MRIGKTFLAASAALAVSLGVAGCGSDSGGSGSASQDLEGVSLTVGSKDFTENILLGKMFAKAVEANGAEVSDKTNLGGSAVNRSALLNKEIDMTPEYNGTGWTVYLKHDNPAKDPKVLFDKVAAEDLKKNGVKWFGTSPFNDTYGFAASPDMAEKNGGEFDLQGMADYLKANPSAKVCMETEFPDRPDGLTLFEKATGYKIPASQIQILETGLIYTQTGKNQCDFGEVFTTDGRIQALKLSLVKDPGVFILYNVSFTMLNEEYEKHAEVYDKLADQILEPLDNEKMAALNAQVDVEGTPADKVAEDYLKEQGII